MDVIVLAKEFAARDSRFWSITEPGALAAWVIGDPEVYAPAAELPGTLERVDELRGGDADEPVRLLALGLMGALIRSTVPHAGEVAGRHWTVTLKAWPEERRLRLTVGPAEVATLYWTPDADDIEDIRLRLAAAPIETALRNGDLDRTTMLEYGIGAMADGPQPNAADAVRYRCVGIEAATWFLSRPAVVGAARLLNARLYADGRFPLAGTHDAALAAQTWAASEVLADDAGRNPAPGFDRPYGGQVTQEPVRVSAEAHQAALADRDALCRRLIARLDAYGIAAGELMSPQVDVAWRGCRGDQVVAVVRSCHEGTDTDQLRAGLGQVLEYRQRLGGPVAGVLLVSRVRDPIWYDVCKRAGVQLLAGDQEEGWRLATL